MALLPLAVVLAVPLLWAGMQLATGSSHAAASGHVFSVAQVQEGFTTSPRAWLGRVVYVRAIAYGCWASGGRDTANCRWRPGLIDRIGQTDALALTWAAPSRLLQALRRLPLVGGPLARGRGRYIRRRGWQSMPSTVLASGKCFLPLPEKYPPRMDMHLL
jgi:hypothetical protein